MPINMKKAANIELLGQYLDGSTDERMSAIIQGWLCSALDDPQLDAELEGRFGGMVVSGEPTGETHKRYRELERILASGGHVAVPAKNQITGKAKRRRVMLRVAAVLLPAFIAAGALLWSSKPKVEPLAENTIIEGTHVVTEPGHRKKVELEDNSAVTVNENTRIVYSDDFKVNREVYVEGEAHFVVEKDPNRPFFVRTKYVTIEVTGTEFNVRAVDGEQSMTVALTQGSVRIIADNHETAMEKGHRYEFDYQSRQADVEPYEDDGWWTEPIEFRDLTLGEIFDRIEDYYGVTLKGKEKLASDPLRYNIGFDSGEKLETVLGTVSRYCGLFTYSASGETVSIMPK